MSWVDMRSMCHNYLFLFYISASVHLSFLFLECCTCRRLIEEVVKECGAKNSTKQSGFSSHNRSRKNSVCCPWFVVGKLLDRFFVNPNSRFNNYCFNQYARNGFILMFAWHVHIKHASDVTHIRYLRSEWQNYKIVRFGLILRLPV